MKSCKRKKLTSRKWTKLRPWSWVKLPETSNLFGTTLSQVLKGQRWHHQQDQLGCKVWFALQPLSAQECQGSSATSWNTYGSHLWTAEDLGLMVLFSVGINSSISLQLRAEPIQLPGAKLPLLVIYLKACPTMSPFLPRALTRFHNNSIFRSSVRWLTAVWDAVWMVKSWNWISLRIIEADCVLARWESCGIKDRLAAPVPCGDPWSDAVAIGLRDCAEHLFRHSKNPISSASNSSSPKPYALRFASDTSLCG